MPLKIGSNVAMPATKNPPTPIISNKYRRMFAADVLAWKDSYVLDVWNDERWTSEQDRSHPGARIPMAESGNRHSSKEQAAAPMNTVLVIRRLKANQGSALLEASPVVGGRCEVMTPL